RATFKIDVYSSTERPCSATAFTSSLLASATTLLVGGCVRAERACYIEGARILGRLDANEGKQPKIAVTAKPPDQFGHVDARMCLVNCLDVDRNVRPENLALCAIGCDAVDGGQRIRRNHCAPPAYHVAIVVIVRWLDQNELEASPWRHRDLQTMAH